LRGHVENGLVDQTGIGRGTSYRLAADVTAAESETALSDEERIVDFVREHGSITNEQGRDVLGVEAHRIYYLLRKLADAGRLRPTGSGRWRKYVLP